MNFRQIAEQNRKLLMGSSSLINERVGPPRFKPRPIRNPIRYGPDPRHYDYPHIPLPNKFYPTFADQPQWREFYKRYLGLESWEPERLPGPPGARRYRSDILKRFHDGNEADRITLSTLSAELPNNITVVDVVVYHNGYVLLEGKDGIVYWLGIDGHGNLCIFPTEIDTFPSEFDLELFPTIFKPEKDWIYHNPGRPSSVTPGTGNPMDPQGYNDPNQPTGPSPGLGLGVIAPMLLPFAAPNTAPANPYSPYEVPQGLPQFPGGQPWDPYQEYQPQYDDPNDLQAPGY